MEQNTTRSFSRLAFFLLFGFAAAYPSFRAAASTLSMVSLEKETLYFLFRIMDTVAWETPASLATSVDVTFFFLIIPSLT